MTSQCLRAQETTNHGSPIFGKLETFCTVMSFSVAGKRQNRQLPKCINRQDVAPLFIFHQLLRNKDHEGITVPRFPFCQTLKDTSDLCAFLQDNLRVHSRSSPESRDRGRELGKCATCGTMLSQLKREAVHLALNGGHHLSGARNAAPLGQSGTKLGDRSASQPHSLNHCPQSPRTPRSPRTPQRTPQTLRRRLAKPPNQDMDRPIEEQHRVSPDGVAFYPHHQVPVKAFF